MINSQEAPTDAQSRRLLIRNVVLFFTSVFMFYMIFLAGWRVLDKPFRIYFLAQNNFLFPRYGPHARISFVNTTIPSKDSDVDIRLENRKVGKRGTLLLSSRRLNYLPTAFTLSLILASRTPWKRRIISLVLGFLLIQVFVSFDMWLRIRGFLSAGQQSPLHVIALYPPGGFWSIAHKVISLSPVTPYIAPAIIWLLVTFRKQDWDQILPSRPA